MIPMNIWRIIWELSEFTGIGLGRFAPLVFGKMIGKEGVRVDKDTNTEAESFWDTEIVPLIQFVLGYFQEQIVPIFQRVKELLEEQS